MTTTSAKQILQQAAELVGGDRERTHGTKLRNFTNIAKLWQTFLEIRRDPRLPLNAEDIAAMNVLQKLARTQTGEYNPDDWADICGYGGCGGEVASVLNSPAVPKFLQDKKPGELIPVPAGRSIQDFVNNGA